ncbi:ubiquitin-conjugating enzyme E2 L3-like [Phacochoerus africanus]|uniref:ubiquitin-conjugating enzyme E2 L3-like n=1 Tax=Phacochoerus africanus TaxID=41426 RepID=UPI001FD988A0|nr:ubiquitin-conjugating enzyme E2 L3-like [Phacochoerus africanus]
MAASRRLMRDTPPYDKEAFGVEIIVPAEYPFKPPKITFKTKISHLNINEKGQIWRQICPLVISAENWKPTTNTHQVIQSLIALVDDPQSERPFGLTQQKIILKDCKKFCENAEEFIKKEWEKVTCGLKFAAIDSCM